MGEDEYRETLANSRRFEYANGFVTAKRGAEMTQKAHWIAADELTEAFRSYRRSVGGLSGQTPTTNFSEGTDRVYRLPDLAYWAAGREVGSGIANPPTAGIEIVSPDQSIGELRAKCQFYRERGVAVCWLVHPGQRWVEVWDSTRVAQRLAAGAELESDSLPGFSYSVAALWAAVDAAQP